VSGQQVKLNSLPQMPPEERTTEIMNDAHSELPARVVRNRHLLILLAVAAAIALSVVVSFLLRFDLAIPDNQRRNLFAGVVIALATKLSIFYVMKLNRGWWTWVSLVDFRRLLEGNLVGSIVFISAARLIMGSTFPRSIYLLEPVVCFMAFSTLRMILQTSRELISHASKERKVRRTIVYGSGWAANSLVYEMRSNPKLGYRVVGVLDDDLESREAVPLEVRVLGGGKDLGKVLEEFKKAGDPIDEVLVALPTAAAAEMKEAAETCRKAGVTCKTLPVLDDILTGKSLARQIREVSLEDLLFRKPIVLQDPQVKESIKGKRVLVTGAAGSIGSELCRQLASFGPERLVLLDQGESPLFYVDLELAERYPLLNKAAEIGDIRDALRMREVIERHQIQSIFHAAAYKHVPLMEAHALEAAANNVLGTKHLVDAAYKAGVETFVMISSDKAVNPTNVMGATKRAAELVVRSIATQERGCATKFVSVRFGNVLGSNGSVIPIFQKQMAAGGPITVTHPEVRRYFMTIREAVSLVLQASTMGRESQIFVVDMGQPIRIADLARSMITLAGLEPDKDIQIVYTGLRPGEKLYEELLTSDEETLPTHHEKIRVFRQEPIPHQRMEEWVNELSEIVLRRDAAGVVAHLKALIPEYNVSDTWLKAIETVTNNRPLMGRQ
jgi:FlaA1/EpsC-like NDP-sugar epimerase